MANKKVFVEEVEYEESYPKCVYHKDFNSDGDEKNLLKHCKVVKSESQLKALGSDWGPHPSLKPESEKAEVKPVSFLKKKPE